MNKHLFFLITLLLPQIIFSQKIKSKDFIGVWKLVKQKSQEGKVGFEDAGKLLIIHKNGEIKTGKNINNSPVIGSWKYDELNNNFTIINLTEDDYKVLKLTKKELVIEQNEQIFFEKVKIKKQSKKTKINIKIAPKQLIGKWKIKTIEIGDKIDSDNEKYLLILASGKLEGGLIGRTPTLYGNWNYNKKNKIFTILETEEAKNGEGDYQILELNNNTLILYKEPRKITLEKL